MDLRRLKAVFIVLLVIINCILGFVLFSAKNYENREKQQIAESLDEVLARDGIYLHGELDIPQSPKVSSFYLEKMFGSTDEMAKKFLGDGFVNMDNGNFTSEMGELTVSGDEFVFRSKTTGAAVEDFSVDNMETLCRREMNRLGMPEEIYSFAGQNSVEGGTKIIFTVKQEDAEFFDAYVTFEFSEKGLSGVSGKNIISGLDESKSEILYFSAPSILADLGGSKALVSGQKHTVMSVKPGYYIGRSAESYKNILAIPVWQITTDTGVVLHYDARNGKEIAD